MVHRAIFMGDIFISYAREDQERIEPVVKALQSRNWSVWWDSRLLAGETFDEVIERELNAARCVVVLWTEISVRKRWVRTEANEGLGRDILVPAMLDEVQVPLAFRMVQTARLFTGSGSEMAKLMAAVVKVLEPARGGVVLAGATKVNPKDGLTYVWVPPGRFTMGCSPGDSECSDREKPAHEVAITKGFWMGETPVTQDAYERVIGKNPSYFKGAKGTPHNNIYFMRSASVARWYSSTLDLWDGFGD